MRRIRPAFTYGAVMFFVLTASGLTFTQQVRDRQLTPVVDPATIQMPVEILSIKINGRNVQPGEKIKGGDDWLRGLSFTLKNISDKPIAYVCVGLRFPRPKVVVVYTLDYGVDYSRGERRRESSPPAIQPGETVDLALTKEKYQSFLDILARGGASPSFDTAPYLIERISFENDPDVIWEGGNLKRRDPNQPTKFNVVERYILPVRQK
ncbi:MAG: hypothetical protein ACJ741_10750 [Pyrinomonadaceae bacterium]